MIAAAAVVLWVQLGRSPSSNDSPPVPVGPIPLGGAATMGEETAPITMLIFSDFQCPYCGKFARETLPELEKEFVRSGIVRVVFRHDPIESIHPYAFEAAVGAECARRQGQFWPMHNGMFADQSGLTAPSLEELAVTLGLDKEQFTECRAADPADSVRRDLEIAKGLKVSATPTVFVGKTLERSEMRATAVIAGAGSLESFRRAISEARQEPVR